MDRIRSLLLTRSHVVAVDPAVLSASGARAPAGRAIDQLELELLHIGFVLSLDLATMLRRLPEAAVEELRAWMVPDLARARGAAAPPAGLAEDAEDAPDAPRTPYGRLAASWLRASGEQPCPWCSGATSVNSLAPCGHLVCEACWTDGGHAACPICRRRVPRDAPFARLPEADASDVRPATTLVVLQLAFDVRTTARQRFGRLIARTSPASPADREELVATIDAIGEEAASWLPAHVPARATLAVALARLWQVAADRDATMQATREHVQTATDVLRVACALMGADPALTAPRRLGPLPRPLRRCVLAALDQLPLEEVIEDMRRHRRLWTRVGERLHVFEHAARHPGVALAFVVLRGSALSTLERGEELRALASSLPSLRVEDDRVRAIAWAGPIEDALRAGNPRSALVRLTHRPGELLRRADHLVRLAQTRQPEALQTLLKAVEIACLRAPPEAMLALAAHVARRARPWPRRVFAPGGRALRAWSVADRRAPLRGDAIALMVGAVRRALCVRAESNQPFPRAVIDRALVDLLVPSGARDAHAARIEWPRGSELEVPGGQVLRLAVHWREPPARRARLALSISLFDAQWRHVATCDGEHPHVSGRRGRAATHASAAPGLAGAAGSAERVDLHLEQLVMEGARHALMVVHVHSALPLEQLPRCFAAVAVDPDDQAAFDPRAIAHRFDLRGRATITVPLALDLAERRLRWLDARIEDPGGVARVGGMRAALAHLGRDLGDLYGVHARASMWDLACVHGAARANVVYVRERDGSVTVYKRRDGESKTARLGRLMSGASDDGRLPSVPSAEAPTWFALVAGLPLPRGSLGYVLDPRTVPEGVELRSAGDLVAELIARPRPP